MGDIDWDEAERVCGAAQLCVVVGTSMSLRHVTHMPFMAKHTVIVNLQKTPDDADADLRIFAHADAVISAVMEQLELVVQPAPPPAKKAKLPAVPQRKAAVTSMRRHIQSQSRVKQSEKEVEVEARAVGVSVRGNQVVRCASGSQAEDLGVKTGWRIVQIAGETMPSEGQRAANAITKALAAAKAAGQRYKIVFAVQSSSATTAERSRPQNA